MTTPDAPTQGMIFRGSIPDFVNEEDLATFKKTINTVVDLRSPREQKTSRPFKGVEAPDRREVVPFRYNYTTWDEVWAGKRIGLAKRRYEIDLIQPMQEAILYSSAIMVQIYFVVLMLFCNTRGATHYLVKNSILQREGLLGLNKTLLTKSEKEIKKVLDVLLEPTSYPVFIHCTAGKDRTGLIIMLLLGILEVDESSIVYDYYKSQEFVNENRDLLVSEANKLGLEDFVDIKPEVMKGTLLFIKENYGSVNAYMTKIGVSKEKRDRIKAFLTEKGEE
ncbi:hypothetical protein HK101_007533 [Irineochytrium annulatum]|nr:hypothetical protein HK101_007533 [Irineochytrium annulatum]